MRVTSPTKYGTNDSVAPGGSNTYEHNSGQGCLSFEVWASITTSGDASSGVDISVKRKTGPSGTVAGSGLTVSIDIGTTEVVYLGEYSPGTVDVVVKNNDADYAATINGIWVREIVE